MKLGYLIIATTLICMAFLTSASTTVGHHLGQGIESGDRLEYIEPNTGSDDVRKDCTVKIDHDIPGGGSVKGEMTFHDVTWWQCTKLQVVAWFDRTF
jgi:allophanate hydrolase subunit 2